MMKKTKYLPLLISLSLVLVLTGCKKKNKNENVTIVEKETTAPEDTWEPEYSYSEKYQTDEEKRYLKSIVYDEMDVSALIENGSYTDQKINYTDFSTALPVGDKVILTAENAVFKSAALMDNDVPYIEKNSVVYFLNKVFNDKEMIEFIDDNGNTGWVSANYAQKVYSPEDSIIKKLWVKDGYDFVRFSPVGENLSFHRWAFRHSAEEGVSVCNRATGEEIFTAYANPYSRIACAYSSDGRYFYYIEDDNTLCQLDTETKESEKVCSFYNYNEERYETITGIYPLPDGDNVLLALYTGWGMYSQSTKNHWNVPSDEFMWANSFAFSPDGKLIAGSATNPAGICIWDMNGNLCWSQYYDILGELYFSEDSKTLYVVNGTGITALDAETGEEKSKIQINLPYQMRLVDYEINIKKDRVVYAMNERISDDEEDEAPYIYVYELSTGKIVQAERIQDNGKKVEDVTLSPDGQYIAIRIRDGSHVNECHQVICQIDLDKEARKLPVIHRSETEEKALNFLLDTSFELGYWSLNFYYDGTYTVSGRHDGTMTGRYELYENEWGTLRVKFSGCGYGDTEEEFEYEHQDAYGNTYVTYFPGEYVLNPDYIDFNICGAFTYTDDCEIAIPSSKQSPSGQEYDYFFANTGTFEKVYKYPGWGEKDQALLWINENTKMRKEPFLDSDVVYMSHYDYDTGVYTESRCVLFADTTHRIIGATVRKDTIDGVTAPWYLVVEYNGADGPDTEARLVWCFGGYSEVVYTDR